MEPATHREVANPIKEAKAPREWWIAHTQRAAAEGRLWAYPSKEQAQRIADGADFGGRDGFAVHVREVRADDIDHDLVIDVACAFEQQRALKIVEAVETVVERFHEGAFRAGFEQACEEIAHRLRTEEWRGCLSPVGSPNAGKRVATAVAAPASSEQSPAQPKHWLDLSDKTRDLLFAVVGEITRRIEVCGASPELTAASSLACDLAGAIGNRWNAPRSYAIETICKVADDLAAPQPEHAP